MEKEQLSNLRANIERRKLISTVFSGLGLLIIFVSTLILFILIAQMMMAGLPRITPQFLLLFLVVTLKKLVFFPLGWEPC